jgi:hypothetical protein
MRSPAKQAETDFDDLLGQLTDELAMTPPSESGVALVPDLEPPKVHVASTHQMAAEAAAAAGVLQPPVIISKPDNTVVKVVGIIAAALTVVSVAALIMFGQAERAAEPAAVEDAAVAESDATERDAAERLAEQQAHEMAMQAERAADKAELVRIEAARLTAQLAAKAKSESKPKPKPRTKPKPKPQPGDDFDIL